MNSSGRAGLAAVQLLALLAAAVLVLGPRPRLVVQQWESRTIYPVWVVAILVVAVVAVLVSAKARPGSPRWGAGLGALVVCGAQLAGLGLWAARHWKVVTFYGFVPSQALAQQLVLCAALLAGTGALLVASVVVLVRRTPTGPAAPGGGPGRATRVARLLLGVLLLLGYPPLLVLTGGSELRDPSSLVALVLVVGLPWGGGLLFASRGLAGAQWGAQRGALLAVAVLGVAWAMVPATALELKADPLLLVPAVAAGLLLVVDTVPALRRAHPAGA
ncbi:hypothetical protein [Nocardioides sp. GY 10127]|uniref:hypothetical protein n=1 Tax=Nocardioides sp. GY 10127 TaxID=2569762 RepID=UPI0010A86D36|nr:hypothetical protein [Nocardioides sp. GY 10127]TIC80019.1 hypothetical protein E8D37_15410 [Nocardioides sp. GY 10127]